MIVKASLPDAEKHWKLEPRADDLKRTENYGYKLKYHSVQESVYKAGTWEITPFHQQIYVNFDQWNFILMIKLISWLFIN